MNCKVDYVSFIMKEWP